MVPRSRHWPGKGNVDRGWTSSAFDWLVNSDKAIYAIVITTVAVAELMMAISWLRGIDSGWCGAVDGAFHGRSTTASSSPCCRRVFLSASSCSPYGDQELRPGDRPDQQQTAEAAEYSKPTVCSYTFTGTRNGHGPGQGRLSFMMPFTPLMTLPVPPLDLQGGHGWARGPFHTHMVAERSATCMCAGILSWPWCLLCPCRRCCCIGWSPIRL